MVYVFVLLLIVAVLLVVTVHVVPEYERAVVFRFGRVLGVKGPGLITTVPGVDRVERVSLRVVTFDVPGRGLLTRDNVTVAVQAAAYARVADPVKALVDVESHFLAAAQVIQTSLREVVGQSSLDTLLHDPASVGHRVKQLVDPRVAEWGVEVDRVEVKDVELPEPMRRALGRVAESSAADDF
jgi:regulator of protease activity HflC (stomatin/prohibitin superfamily)